MNERDSEAVGASFVKAGHLLVAKEEDADVLLFNTCSVRDAAERKAKGKIGYMRKLKLRKPELIIGVMGCMAQRLGDELLAELPHLDFVLGTGQIHRALETAERKVDFPALGYPRSPTSARTFSSRVTQSPFPS